jgi:hypothetical protein
VSCKRLYKLHVPPLPLPPPPPPPLEVELEFATVNDQYLALLLVAKLQHAPRSASWDVFVGVSEEQCWSGKQIVMKKEEEGEEKGEEEGRMSYMKHLLCRILERWSIAAATGCHHHRTSGKTRIRLTAARTRHNGTQKYRRRQQRLL